MRISDWSSDVCSSDLSLLPRLSIQSMDAADREIRSWLAERRSIAIDAPADVPASGDRTITVMLSGGIKQASYKARVDRPEAESDSRSLRFAVDVKPVPGPLGRASRRERVCQYE